MIVDCNDLASGTPLHADLCIIGGGAAGITLALQFLHNGHCVLLLESGGWKNEPDTQALYEGEVVDEHLHSPADKYRSRRLGGSTTIWGGRCVPFDAIDFQPRPWLGLPAWPFALDSLLPYYNEANRLCEAGRFAYSADTAFPHGMRPLLQNFESASFTDSTLERFSCPTNFARRYRARLSSSKNITLLLHANVTELHTTEHGRIARAATVKTLDGKILTVTAENFVLATGGLETPRLLLASRDHHQNGIGNEHDHVGRHYMCHIAGTIGDIALNGPPDHHWHGYEQSPDGIYCRRRFALTADAQRNLAIGNFIARLHHPRIPDPIHRTGALSALFLAKPFISYEYRKRLHGNAAISPAIWAAHIRNLLTDTSGTAAFLTHWFRHRICADRKFPTIIIRSKTQRYSLDFHAEQQPNPASRITLTNRTDALGMPQLRIDWRYTQNDIRTVRIAAHALSSDIAQSGCGTFTFDDDELEPCAIRDGAYGGHHIGTTRMASSARNGVVDEHGRIHGMRNLFIAGSATFPTSSQANPTLTIVAMALRLADHLRATQRKVVVNEVGPT